MLRLPRLAANTPADQVGETAFWTLAKLIVSRRFLAYYKSAAAVSRIKPFAGGHLSSAGAVEPHAGAHLDEGPTLRQLRRLLELDPDQCHPLIIF